MRAVNKLIDQIRRQTELEGTVSATANISDEEILQYVNDAQQYLQEQLERINYHPFLAEDIQDVVANQEAYDLPTDALMGSNIVSIEFSRTGQVADYSTLYRVTMPERETASGSWQPLRYILRQDTVLLNPIPSTSTTNGLRINYSQAAPNLDKRRAIIDAITVVAGQVTALSVDVTAYATFFPGSSAFSSSEILVDDYFCIVATDGTIRARNIPITAINSGTGNATITAYTPASSSETGSVGNYLVAGRDTTTHSTLPNYCEKFLIHWPSWQLLSRNGHDDEAGVQKARVDQIEDSIKSSFMKLFDDVEFATILNDDYLF